jgi:hypothetical protein
MLHEHKLKDLIMDENMFMSKHLNASTTAGTLQWRY